MALGAEDSMTSRIPVIDVHSVEIMAPEERAWQGLINFLARFGSDTTTRALVTMLGCAPRRTSGLPGVVGSTVPGFEVVQCQPPFSLHLMGGHRFSNYALIFRIEPLGKGRSRVHAESRALFPGSTSSVVAGAIHDFGGGAGNHAVGTSYLRLR